MIPQKKSYRTVFLAFFKCSLPVSISKNIMIGKIGKCVCLRDGANLTPLMPELALVYRFTVHFAVAKKRVFIVTFENKKLDRF